MITKSTAASIAHAYCELEAAAELLKIIDEGKQHYEEPDFRDVFGRRRGLQLGVPTGQGSHRLLDVSPKLAEIVIKAHIENKKHEIAALCEIARNEYSPNNPLKD